MLHGEILKPWLKSLKLSAKDYCRMINNSFDPKVLQSTRNIIIDSTHIIKSYSCEKFFNEIISAEERFLSDAQPGNIEASK